MKVDRSRFLLLTTALSAATAVAITAGCTVKSSDNGSSGTTTPPTEAGSPYDSSPDAYATDGDTDGGSCLDDTGSAPDCTAQTGTACTTVCQHYLPNYKKGVARSIADCLKLLPSCEGADNAILACVQTALGAACQDPTAEGYCGPLADACNSDAGTDAGAASPLEKQDCVDLANGLNSTGRAAFTTCITEGMTTAGYCTSDPTSCIDQIE